MPVSVQFLFNRPQCEIASLLRGRLSTCQSASLVAGFITVEGVEAISAPIRSNPAILKTLIVGAGTYRAFEALDRLNVAGVPLANLHVHLGHTRPTTSGATHRFYRYHPMLHSKVYLLEMRDGSAAAFVGSHNLTGFALMGLNGEASMLVEGPADAPEFDDIREHISQAEAQSTPYDPAMKEAYCWWMTQFVEGLRGKVDDAPRDGESKRTIVVLAEADTGQIPAADDIIYFEIAAALGGIQSLRAEVHIYLFDQLPGSPHETLNRLYQAKTSYWCQPAFAG